jgi:hypothetical protein
MNGFQNTDAVWTLEMLGSMGLLNAAEAAMVRALVCEIALGPCVELAETIHLHVKVEDTDRLAHSAFAAGGGILDHARPGFVKFRLPGAINAIFSHIAVSADDLAESACSRRPRPFLDHIGIDMREVSLESRTAFDDIPRRARSRGWAHASQGGPGRAVRCCHVEVAEKLWLFPTAPASRPIEVAYGPLVRTQGASGCDLRPSHPAVALATSARCCSG